MKVIEAVGKARHIRGTQSHETVQAYGSKEGCFVECSVWWNKFRKRIDPESWSSKLNLTVLTRRDALTLPLVQFLPREQPPLVYRWSGSAREIGRQHGSALAWEIRQELSPSLAHLAQQRSQSEIACARDVWRRYSDVFRQHVPSAIEEIEGIAEGSGLPLEIAFFGATRDLLLMPDVTEGCTAVICGSQRSASGVPIIGQTKDTTAPLDRYKLMVTSYKFGLRAISLGYPGWIGNISLNSHGLAWTGNSLYAPQPTGDLLPGSLLKRIFLESATVDEVLKRTKRMRFGNACFCLADRTGRTACMEWVEGTCDHVETGDALFAHANGILGRFGQKDRSAKESPTSAQRQRRADEMVASISSAVTADHFETWFRDHQHAPNSICRHPQHNGEEHTTAAFIADLNTLEFRYVVGFPCQQEFQKISIGEIS